MEKCEICGKNWDIKVNNHIYCAVHYVENEGEECLSWDIYGIMGGNRIGKSEQSSKRIFEEIEKKYPEYIKRYEKERLGELWEELNKLSENELHRLADLMDVGFLNEPEDKDEIVLVLSTEPLEKIKAGLKRLKSADSD